MTKSSYSLIVKLTDEWETAEIEKFKREHYGQRPLANRAK